MSIETGLEREQEGAVIRVQGLKKSIRSGSRSVEILRGIDLEVFPGEVVAILGASGSGKSTLLGLLAGLDDASAGSIYLAGYEITAVSEEKMAHVRGKTIGFVFQSYQLISTLTALENVLLPHELNGAGDGRERAQQLLDSVGLSERAGHYPVQLSGGEQQRVALARAFMMGPPIILADEPTGNLDSENGEHVLELLLTLNRQQGTTLLLVTHDERIAERATRRIYLRDGAVLSDTGNLSGKWQAEGARDGR